MSSRRLVTTFQKWNHINKSTSRGLLQPKNGPAFVIAKYSVCCHTGINNHRFRKVPDLKVFTVVSRSYCCNKEHIFESPYGDIVIPDLSVHEYIWGLSDQWGDNIASQCGVTGRSYTYTEGKSLSKTIAASLHNKFGLKKGDCFAVVLPNLPEFPFIFLAGSEAGLIMTTVNPIYTPEEIAKQLKDSKARLIFTVPGRFEVVTAAAKLIGQNLPIIVLHDKSEALPPGATSFSEVTDKDTCGKLTPVKISKDDTLVLPYSSGTTGLPKGVELTQGNIVANVHQLDQPGVRLLLQTTKDVQDVVLGVLPFFHIYGMVVVMFTCLAAGAKLVTLPKFDPTLFIETIVKYQVKLLYVVPPLILFMGSHPSVTPEHLESVRTILSGAAPCGQKDIERVLLRGKHLNIVQGYGLTETSPCILNSHQGRAHKYAAAGVPVPSTKVKIVDPVTKQVLPRGKVGELVVHGPQVMKGYFNQPEANKDIFDHHGWLRTGDLGYVDEDGDFFVVDRLKELIKVKGFQVAPAELEEILRSHPKIVDAAVIGIKNESAGEVPKAFVVVKPGITATEDEIKEFVANQVTKYKRLEGGVVILDSIPKSAAGKILRKELKAKYGS